VFDFEFICEGVRLGSWMRVEGVRVGSGFVTKGVIVALSFRFSFSTCAWEGVLCCAFSATVGSKLCSCFDVRVGKCMAAMRSLAIGWVLGG
jgi:hypothetical protein